MKNLKMSNIIKGVVVGFVSLFAIFGFYNLFVYSGGKDKSEIKTNNYKPDYFVQAFPIPDEVFFAEEEVPIYNFDVKEALDLELLKISFWHSETFLYLKRANRFFPVIEPILKKYQIPDDFKFLSIAESGLVNVSSPAGAKGYWQFMESTAKEYGLTVNEEVDERYNLEKSTEAACKYLKNAYRKFKSWSMVAAMYNAGGGRIEKTANEQKQNSYYDLLLNQETGRYVYRIIALKLVMSRPNDYGLSVKDEDLYSVIETKDIEIDSSIVNLVDFAIKNKINYKLFKYFNPWLRQNYLKNSAKKKYIFKIPTGNQRKFNFINVQFDTTSVK